MSVHRGEHRNRHERANSAATFVDLKMKRLVRRIDARADCVNGEPEKIANRARCAGLDELESGRRLGQKIQRHHEKQVGDRKEKDARDISSPYAEDNDE